ncbi:polyribonucleotide nucleotidyltransferase [bacterium]|nr:polyribonucleotide nucleotidyltransferase [bacterium]OIO44411.1 MAG: polyribonucleotide nucleotidyltransferase [Parcubacteria group bacterium CG1_02_36_42]
MNYKLDLSGKELKVEISNLAEQASGSCFVRYGDTEVLATVVMSKYEREEDFFPLTVDYEERYYAAGKILGSRYIRRESRPSDEAIITSRLIDRTIRPLFPEILKRETQVIVTCLSWDRENDPDIFGLIAASTALSISEIPWSGPIAVVRIGRLNDEMIINPTYEQRERSDLDLVLAGVEKEGDILINMIEAEGTEIPEEVILKAVDFGKPYLKKIIDFQNQIVKEVGKEKIKIETLPQDLKLEKEMKGFLGERLEKAIFQSNKTERFEDLSSLKEELISYAEGKYPGEGKYARDLVKENKSSFLPSLPLRVSSVFEKEIKRLVHKNIILKERRPDGRKLDELREIGCQAGLLPRTHGSGLFCRGQTKALSILTLGAPTDVKLLQGMEIIGEKRFMHHYNFPPYSTGEVKPIRGPGRRDIGHGMLVEKALLPLVPSFEEFPYTIRIVTEILSSNGSTSMASVSSSSLALMDAGVKIKRPAAGISIGLIQNKDGQYKLLTDIQGPEDHYGDMDFKIAGTRKGITAIQMDVKIEGITKEIFKEVLERGKKARIQILEKMEEILPGPRPELSPFAPRTLTLQINPEKIREVIGPGGRVINEIIAECGVSIDVEETGKIFVTAEKEEAVKKAIAWIKNITREIKVGEVFQGRVKRILNFGAFIEILPGQEGLLHISRLGRRVERVEDILKIGDVVPVEVISIDEQGRINLSMTL